MQKNMFMLVGIMMVSLCLSAKTDTAGCYIPDAISGCNMALCTKVTSGQPCAYSCQCTNPLNGTTVTSEAVFNQGKNYNYINCRGYIVAGNQCPIQVNQPAPGEFPGLSKNFNANNPYCSWKFVGSADQPFLYKPICGYNIPTQNIDFNAMDESTIDCSHIFDTPSGSYEGSCTNNQIQGTYPDCYLHGECSWKTWDNSGRKSSPLYIKDCLHWEKVCNHDGKLKCGNC